MSDDILRMLRENDARLAQTEVKEVPPLYLPWSQRALNPFPLASSGGTWGDMPQPWAVSLLTWTVTLDVITTNNATNYWTVALIEGTTGNTLASFTTAAIAANAVTRFSIPAASITQPAAANSFVGIKLTATLNPGAIFIFPALALLRTGN